MGFGISSVGGAGTDTANWNGYSLTTNAVANVEDSTDYGQPVFCCAVFNDSDTDIVVGYGVSTSTKSFTIKAGEALAVEVVHKTLYYKSAGTAKSFRVLVIW